jgi:hypothetical protein
MNVERRYLVTTCSPAKPHPSASMPCPADQPCAAAGDSLGPDSAGGQAASEQEPPDAF